MYSDRRYDDVMTSLGFFRVSAAFANVRIADVEYNTATTIEAINAAQALGAELLVMPELNVCGYTCADLFNQQLLIDKTAESLVIIARAAAGLQVMAVVGAPVIADGKLFNCGVAIAGGKILGVVPKTHLPNYNEFYEKRWFTSPTGLDIEKCHICGTEVPFGTDLLFRHRGACIGIELCEDLWTAAPPSSRLALAGADIIANLSATDELIGKHDYLLSLIKGQSARCRCVYAYSSAGPGESSTDAVYAGNAIIAEDGNIIASSPRFSEKPQMVTADCDLTNLHNDRRHFGTFYETTAATAKYRIIDSPTPCQAIDSDTILRNIDPHPFVPAEGPKLDERCREVTSIQTAGLVQRLRATGCKALTVGISGGLDSTLALLIAVKAFDKLGLDRKGIYAITMPGFGTTGRTHSNALTIMHKLGVTSVEIPIGNAVRQHFADIGHDMTTHDVTYENCQARERTQILMDYANRVGGMVLGTGDVSELALGWCTYNADHMSMYSVNCSVPKTLVRHLVSWIASFETDIELRTALTDIVNTPVSPELIPADDKGNITQKTEDLVGPYELHDFFLYHIVRYGAIPQKVFTLAQKAFDGKYDSDTIRHWLRTFYRRFFSQQFKRSCLPDGPKTGSISLSPRADWRMPSDATARLWLQQVDNL